MHNKMVKFGIFIRIIGISFIETSALDATNVEIAFMNVIKDIYHHAISE